MLPSNSYLFIVALWSMACSTVIRNVFVHATTTLAPERHAARRNGHHIFNAIHSAGRQWGSSINHNGLSFFPAVMPKGTLLYHGSQSANRPAGLEWLAFEVEHAEAFAYSFKNGTIPRPPWYHDDLQSPNHETQRPLSSVVGQKDTSNEAYIRGYLHTYRANRDLKLLYCDGMSAAKTSQGTFDTQDLVLLDSKTPNNDRERASSICNLLLQWGYDGLIRMEIGFEVVYCDFEKKGLDLVMQTRTSRERQTFTDASNIFPWARAVAERYDGIGGDRVRLDFSSMVSGFLFQINTSNTDPTRPDLPRLTAASPEELRGIKAYLQGITTEPRRFTVHWQAVADMIVSRYARRLALLAHTEQTLDMVKGELKAAIQMYINAPPRAGDVNVNDISGENGSAEALRLCQQHYLLPAYTHRESWRLEDELTHAAFQRVMTDICNTLFAAFKIVSKSSSDDATRRRQLRDGQKLLQALNRQLAWTTWKKPERCAVDEVLLTVMWPLGDPEDYWHPDCRSYDEVLYGRRGYWPEISTPPAPTQSKGTVFP